MYAFIYYFNVSIRDLIVIYNGYTWASSVIKLNEIFYKTVVKPVMSMALNVGQLGLRKQHIYKKSVYEIWILRWISKNT